MALQVIHPPLGRDVEAKVPHIPLALREGLTPPFLAP